MYEDILRQLGMDRYHAHADDLHFSRGPLLDEAAARAAIDVDAAKDRKWLRRHPRAQYRIRPISPREIQATGMLADTRVVIVRGPGGCQIRAMLKPRATPTEQPME